MSPYITRRWILPFVFLSMSVQFGTSFCTTFNFCEDARNTRLQLSPQQLGSFNKLDVKEDIEFRCVLWRDMLDQGPVKYQLAWDLQKKLLADQVNRVVLKDNQIDPFWDGTVGKMGLDTIIVVEHEPVYTLGTASDERFLLHPLNTRIPVIRINRGGEITYHGTGQLTVYPVIDLRHYSQDIHWYMRALEEAVIRAFSKCGVAAERDMETTGVWVRGHKVAAVGVNCKRWITQHGVAINVLEESLDGFEGIIPCGLEGSKVGYLNQFLQSPLSLKGFAYLMRKSLEEVFHVSIIEDQ